MNFSFEKLEVSLGGSGWFTHIILAIGSLWQGSYKLKPSLGYIVGLFLKKKNGFIASNKIQKHKILILKQKCCILQNFPITAPFLLLLKKKKKFPDPK